MTVLLQKSDEEGQMNSMDSRSVMLLTMMSKLMMALVMGIVAMVVLLTG